MSGAERVEDKQSRGATPGERSGEMIYTRWGETVHDILDVQVGKRNGAIKCTIGEAKEADALTLDCFRADGGINEIIETIEKAGFKMVPSEYVIWEKAGR